MGGVVGRQRAGQRAIVWTGGSRITDVKRGRTNKGKRQMVELDIYKHSGRENVCLYVYTNNQLSGIFLDSGSFGSRAQASWVHMFDQLGQLHPEFRRQGALVRFRPDKVGIHGLNLLRDPFSASLLRTSRCPLRPNLSQQPANIRCMISALLYTLINPYSSSSSLCDCLGRLFH